jgi:ankyrin repeat protein
MFAKALIICAHLSCKSIMGTARAWRCCKTISVVQAAEANDTLTIQQWLQRNAKAMDITNVYDGARLRAASDLGNQVNHTNHIGWSPLHFAAKHGNLDMTWTLLSCRWCRVDQASVNGQTPLSVACMYGKHHVAKVLLEHNADVNLRWTSERTALMTAVWRGRVDCVRLLLDHRADVHCTIGKQRAIDMTDNAEIVKLLQKVERADCAFGEGFVTACC